MSQCRKQDNYLENLTDQEATYYIYSGYYGCMQEFRVVFGEIIKQTTPIDIDKATVTDIKVGENFTLSKEEKQRGEEDNFAETPLSDMIICNIEIQQRMRRL